LVQILQKQLDEERNDNHLLRDENHLLRDENQLLQTALHAKNTKHTDSPDETEQKETFHINQIYPQKELTFVKDYGGHYLPNLRPMIRTEYNYVNDEDTNPHITTKETPYTATELAKLKKEYGRLPHESETEYVFRVSLTGGDQIQLSEQEASGYWGHGVFLTTGNRRHLWSLTQHTAY
ncbi:hypothetical protein Nmel_002958, partial [Mimus melanotis]